MGLPASGHDGDQTSTKKRMQHGGKPDWIPGRTSSMTLSLSGSRTFARFNPTTSPLMRFLISVSRFITAWSLLSCEFRDVIV
jgi:hypothetical protein